MEQRLRGQNLLAYAFASFGRHAMRFLSMSFFYRTIRSSNYFQIRQLQQLQFLTIIISFIAILCIPFFSIRMDNSKKIKNLYKSFLYPSALMWIVMEILLFSMTAIRGGVSIYWIVVIFFIHELAYIVNELAFQSLYMTLARQEKNRRTMVSFALLTAFIGRFLVGQILVMQINEKASLAKGHYVFYLVVACTIILFGLSHFMGLKMIRENAIVLEEKEKTDVRKYFQSVFQNRISLILLALLALFTIAIQITSTLLPMHLSMIAAMNNQEINVPLWAGLFEILACLAFFLFSTFFQKEQLFPFSIAMMVIGYIAYLLSPEHVVPMCMSYLMIIVGQTVLSVLFLLMLGDAVEYGQAHFKRRNQAVLTGMYIIVYQGIGLAVKSILDWAFKADLQNRMAEGLLAYREAWVIKSIIIFLPTALLSLVFFGMRSKYKLDESQYIRILELNKSHEKHYKEYTADAKAWLHRTQKGRW